MSLFVKKLQDYVTKSTLEENFSADNCTDRDEEAYVHDTFLAFWRLHASSIQVNHSISNPIEKIPPIQQFGNGEFSSC